MKAAQHLREAGALEDSAKDIGALCKEVQGDVLAECEAEIKEALYLAYVPALRRGFVSGLAEWYKEELLKLSFEGAPPETAQITEAAAA